jgi:hypothetical protein
MKQRQYACLPLILDAFTVSTTCLMAENSVSWPLREEGGEKKEKQEEYELMPWCHPCELSG